MRPAHSSFQEIQEHCEEGKRGRSVSLGIFSRYFGSPEFLNLAFSSERGQQHRRSGKACRGEDQTRLFKFGDRSLPLLLAKQRQHRKRFGSSLD